MKNITSVSFLKPVVLVIALFLLSCAANSQNTVKTNSQDTLKLVPTFPADVDKIVSASCTPCHTKDGKLMSKSKLNFSEWENYSPVKQKQKAGKMLSELNKGKMPPKAAREKRPDLIPTPDQIEIIKKWAESLPADTTK